MGQFFDDIPPWLIPWMEAQHIFWVATAPLSSTGHVNVSPKGCFGKTLNIIVDDEEESFGDPGMTALPAGDISEDKASGKGKHSKAVWYEDLTGSGVETIAHLRENKRITLMLCAFEGPPRVVRLFGTGKVNEFGSPEYNTLLPPSRRQPGSRAVIWVDVHKVGTSCGYSIPFFDYKAPREKLRNGAMKLEKMDHDAACAPSSSEDSAAAPKAAAPGPGGLTGMKSFWRLLNSKSIDGLPGLLDAFNSPVILPDWNLDQIKAGGTLPNGAEDDEGTGIGDNAPSRRHGPDKYNVGRGQLISIGNLTVGFGVGMAVGVALCTGGWLTMAGLARV